MNGAAANICSLAPISSQHGSIGVPIASEDPDSALEGIENMVSYPALVDGEQGAYGVVFPDLPGCVAMGNTVDEALQHAEEALRDYVSEMRNSGWKIAAPSSPERLEVPQGNRLVSVPLTKRTQVPPVQRAGRPRSKQSTLR